VRLNLCDWLKEGNAAVSNIGNILRKANRFDFGLNKV
jgi:hypothetical protein